MATEGILYSLATILCFGTIIVLWRTPNAYHPGVILWIGSILVYMLGLAWPKRFRAAKCWRQEGLQSLWPKSALPPGLLVEISLVGGLTILALGMRVIALDLYPPLMHGDEGEFGVISLSILEGKEAISPFTTYWLTHPTMYNYWQALSMAIFGKDEVGLRALSAITGALSVPILYALVRLYWGWTGASIAAILAAVSHLYVHFSRMALNNIQAAFFMILVLLFLALGRERRSPVCYGLAGLACGYSLYFYMGSRIIPLAAAAMLVFLILEGRLKSSHLLALLMGFVLAVAPLATHYALHPNTFIERTAGIFLFTERNIQHVAGGTVVAWSEVLRRQMERTLRFFVDQGDASSFYLRDLPAFDPITVSLFWLGMAVSLPRFYRFPEFLLLVWFWSVFVAGGILTLDAPNAPRLLIGVPSVFALAGAFVANARAFLTRGLLDHRGLLAGCSRLRLNGATVLVIALLALTALKLNYQTYFVEYAAIAWGTESLAMAREMRAWQDSYKVYLLGAPRIYANHGTIRFIARAAERVDSLRPGDYLPLPTGQKGALFIILPHRLGELAQIRQLYPGGEYREFRDGMQRLQFVSYRYDPREGKP